MAVVSGDILRIVATLAWDDGNLMQNVFNALVTGAGGPWDDQDIADDAEAWMDNMYANLVTLLSTFVDGSQVQVYKYDAVGLDWDEVATNTFTFLPTDTGSELPRGSAGLITARTTNPDVIGKKYIGGLTETFLTQGLWSGGTLVLFLAMAADWIIPFTGGVSGATWTGGVWSVKDSVLYPFTDNIAAIGIPAYQRRRKRGVGI